MKVSPITIPTLETARLRLTPLGAAHAEGMYSLWSDPEVCRYSGPVSDYDGKPLAMPVSRIEESNKLIEFWLRAQADGWGFRWALTLKDSGVFAGTAGFNSIGECSEYAYHLLPAHWGKGLMREASDAALQWVGRSKASLEVEVFIDPNNTPSIALVQRLGFRPTGEFSDGAQRYLKTTVLDQNSDSGDAGNCEC